MTTMELCVLIPKEFSLSTADGRHFVCARQQIEKDKKFTCLEGDFRLGKVGLLETSNLCYFSEKFL